MKTKWICLLLFQIILAMTNVAFSSEPERVPVSLHTIYGRELKGEMKLPYVNSGSVELINGNIKQEIQSADITSITAKRNSGARDMDLYLIYVPSYEYKSIKSEEADLNKVAKWMVKLAELDHVSLYMVAQEYNPVRHYRRNANDLKGAIPANHWLYIQREGEVYPTRISLSPDSGYGSNQHFKAVGRRYFQDCPELCEKIESGTINNQSIVDAIVFYNDWKNNQ